MGVFIAYTFVEKQILRGQKFWGLVVCKQKLVRKTHSCGGWGVVKLHIMCQNTSVGSKKLKKGVCQPCKLCHGRDGLAKTQTESPLSNLGGGDPPARLGKKSMNAFPVKKNLPPKPVAPEN